MMREKATKDFKKSILFFVSAAISMEFKPSHDARTEEMSSSMGGTAETCVDGDLVNGDIRAFFTNKGSSIGTILPCLT